jgi:hypothetical protein
MTSWSATSSRRPEPAKRGRDTLDGMELTRTVQGRPFRKSTFSGAQNDCVFLPSSGPLNAVHDSKSGLTLGLPASALVAFARRQG